MVSTANKPSRIKRVLLNATLACLVSNAQNSAQSQTQNFRFTATINQIIDNSSELDLPSEIIIGSQLSGEFRFDPEMGEGAVSQVVQQPYEFELALPGLELVTSAFEIKSVNDTEVDVQCTEFFCPSFFDTLTLTTMDITANTGSGISDLDSSSSFVELKLSENDFTEPQILQTNGIPGDPSIWNSFQSARSLQIYVSDQQGQRISVTASVSNFIETVPEPGTFSCSALVIFMMIARRCRQSRQMSRSGI